MLKITDLTAFYGDSQILNKVNLEAKDGQITCLIGRNGVGKTTLLKSIMGLVKTPEGSIDLGGTELIKKPTYERAQCGIGYVPQGRDIFPGMTVLENLKLGLETNKKLHSVDEKLFTLFPILETMGKRRGGDLSGGQQQQLAIARALAGRPKIVILDEPTEGIQPSIIQEIGKLILKLKEDGYTIFIVEQYLEFVLEIADYYYLMDKGTIVEEGEVSSVSMEDLQYKLAI